MIIAPFSAIPSWEGFEYQRHIALYTTLVEMKALLDNSIDAASNKYILEIEGSEDFSILDGDSFLSLHQVKAGEFTLDVNDKFSFLISVLQYNANRGFFHILPSKSLPNNFVELTCKAIDSLRMELSCDIRNVDNTASNDEKKKAEKEFIIIEKVSGNSEKGSKYNILKYVLISMGLAINKENIEKVVCIINKDLDEYEQKLIIDGKRANDDNFVQVYPKLFNTITEVNDNSHLLISKILDVIWPDWKLSTANDDSINYPKFIYGQLLLFLKQAITGCHERGEKSCRIPFYEIYSTINRDFRIELLSVAYQYYLVWNSIQESIEKYPQKANNTCADSSCINCKDKPTCNLEKQKQRIAAIKENEMHSFLHKLMLKKPVMGKPNNLPNDNLIHRLMVSLLKDIDCLGMEENYLIQAQRDGTFYRLTLDSSGEAYELQEQLSKEIHYSTDDKLLLFETDVLITDQLNEDVFTINGHSTMVFGKAEYDELKSITSDSIEKVKKNFSKPKVLRLIDRTVVREELK